MKSKIREIKFRGKSLNTGAWVYGDLQHKGKRAFVEYEVNPSTVGQYTEVNDVDGKEIYEGDILYEYFKNELYVDKRIVEYINGSFLAVSTYSKGGQAYGSYHVKYQSLKHFYDIEAEIRVVGNIHDNPDLRIMMKQKSI